MHFQIAIIGPLLTPNEKCTYPWNKCKSEVKKIIIDETITHIPEKAFTNCYHLLEINVPTQCIVAQKAFTNCFSLDIVKAINDIFIQSLLMI